jgi:hypothetical protein
MRVIEASVKTNILQEWDESEPAFVKRQWE